MAAIWLRGADQRTEGELMLRVGSPVVGDASRDRGPHGLVAVPDGEDVHSVRSVDQGIKPAQLGEVCADEGTVGEEVELAETPLHEVQPMSMGGRELQVDAVVVGELGHRRSHLIGGCSHHFM